MMKTPCCNFMIVILSFVDSMLLAWKYLRPYGASIILVEAVDVTEFAVVDKSDLDADGR